MAFWPFGRKSRKSSLADEKMPRKDTLVREATDLSVPALRRRSSRSLSQKRPRSTSRKLSKANAPSVRNAEKTESAPPIPILPEERRRQLNEKSGANKSNQQVTSTAPSTANVPPTNRGDVPSYYFQNPGSTSSLQPENFNVVREPHTIQGKRSAAEIELPRRKSSKRKANDIAREQEIKALSKSSPIPIPRRPTSYQSSPLNRDSRRMPSGMNRNLERPLSEISLPIAESMPSHASFNSDHHGFKVSAVDSLSPRPTIRYSANPRSPNGSLNPSRSSTQKEKQPVFTEENLNTRRRIKNLANDLDASGLRELMERDRRRNERKRISEQERLQRKLERRAAKQREEEATGPEDEAEASNVARKEQITQKATITKVEPQVDTRTQTPDSWQQGAVKDRSSPSDPFRDPVTEAAVTQAGEDLTEEEDIAPIEEISEAALLSQAGPSPPLPPMSPARHAHELSTVSQNSDAKPAGLQPPAKIDLDKRRDSDTSNKASSGWRSMFKRSDTRAKRDSTDRGRMTTPSEFSNTSRESVSRQLPPPSFSRISTNRSTTPKRTVSRFREDLPELTKSPPESHVQSPEIESYDPLPTVPGSRGTDVVDDGKRLSDIHPAYREEVALSRHASIRASSPEAPNAALLSQSLASVDSEGSWLTGRPVKRLSQAQFGRESTAPLDQQRDEGSDLRFDEALPNSEERETIGALPSSNEDRKPDIPKRRRPYLSGTTGIGSDDEDDSSTLHPGPASIRAIENEEKWHGAVGKHPTIVRAGVGPRIKSREGLLNDYQEGESATVMPSSEVEDEDEVSPSRSYSQASTPSAGDSPDSPVDIGMEIQRATSVDVGKGHARHISAGSARLLDLPSRSSQEFLKRLSSGTGGAGPNSGARSPLVPPSPKVPTAATAPDDVD